MYYLLLTVYCEECLKLPAVGKDELYFPTLVGFNF